MTSGVCTSTPGGLGSSAGSGFCEGRGIGPTISRLGASPSIKRTGTLHRPGEHRQWDELVQAVAGSTKDAVRATAESVDDPAVTAKAEDLFLLATRSDLAALDGRAREGGRWLCHDGTGRDGRAVDERRQGSVADLCAGG